MSRLNNMPLRQIRKNEDGATIVEFAMIAPIFLFLLMGTMDVGHALYVKAVLQGAVNKASRDSSLESGSATAIQNAVDQKVRDQVLEVAPNATVNFSREFFRTFTDAGTGNEEPYLDTNTNGTCDQGEQYEDVNNSLEWEADGGADGQGGARDAVAYTVTMTYEGMFPFGDFRRTSVGKKKIGTEDVMVNGQIYKKPIYEDVDASFTLGLIGGGRTVTASSIIANQPFAAQLVAAILYCP